MPSILIATLAVLAAELSLVAVLHAIPKCGSPGRALADRLTHAPALDLVVSAITWLPWVAAFWFWGWPGVLGAILGQVLALYLWAWMHETANRRWRDAPKINRFLSRRFGRIRNHLALWATVGSVPVFWIVRFAEVFLYPFLVVLLGFPRYKHGEWINVSRQKFEGLVGHDLIWCLYCDWMTGVYGLGGEMLRNVESFWCPIRFRSDKKCENCSIDFPDLDKGWIDARGNMQQVVDLLDEKFESGEPIRWFGHPDRDDS